MRSPTHLLTSRGFPGSDVKAYLPLLLGGGLFVILTFISVIQQSWVSEDAAHSPLIVAIASWLLVRQWPEASATAWPGSPALALPILVPVLLAYVVAQWLEWVTIAGYTAWMALVVTAYGAIGAASLGRLWFPLAYMLLALPLPKGTTILLTQDLRLALSDYAVAVLDLIGYPVAREGVTIFVDRYQLLVEEACSGLNSMISLTAVGLFYAYVRHGSSWRYILIFTVAMVAVAMAANLVRILALMLITYHFGNAAAESFIHEAAGLTLFLLALIGMFAVDRLLAPVRARLAPQG
jgi:exosortase